MSATHAEVSEDIIDWCMPPWQTAGCENDSCRSSSVVDELYPGSRGMRGCGVHPYSLAAPPQRSGMKSLSQRPSESLLAFLHRSYSLLSFSL